MTSRFLLTVVATGFLFGCVDQYGRVRPSDPIGRAIFDALDPSVPVYQPREYKQRFVQAIQADGFAFFERDLQVSSHGEIFERR